jgi:hypothetical protein
VEWCEPFTSRFPRQGVSEDAYVVVLELEQVSVATNGSRRLRADQLSGGLGRRHQ